MVEPSVAMELQDLVRDMDRAFARTDYSIRTREMAGRPTVAVEVSYAHGHLQVYRDGEDVVLTARDSRRENGDSRARLSGCSHGVIVAAGRSLVSEIAAERPGRNVPAT